ncbi:hypothetical protein NFI96_015589 [Prochilodus magdalenae]|nr:hypothetical protein NFI96_015589 [Prochilodus magdalenae]
MELHPQIRVNRFIAGPCARILHIQAEVGRRAQPNAVLEKVFTSISKCSVGHPLVLQQWSQDAALRTVPSGRCPRGAAHGALPTGCLPQDASHGTPPTGRLPLDASHGTPPTGRLPQDASHRMPPTGCLPQDADLRTLPTGRCPQNAAPRTLDTFGLVDDSQSSSDTEVVVIGNILIPPFDNTRFFFPRLKAARWAFQTVGLGGAKDPTMVPTPTEPGQAQHKNQILREHVGPPAWVLVFTPHLPTCNLAPFVAAAKSLLIVWRFTFYLCIFTYGFCFLWQNPWMWDTRQCWYNYPKQVLSPGLYYYYLTELAFYWSLMFSQFTDIKRKDFLIMFVHHLATVSLISFSYANNMARVGSLVMCVHDASDFLLEAAKLANYAKYQRLCDFLFVAFGAAFK